MIILEKLSVAEWSLTIFDQLTPFLLLLAKLRCVHQAHGASGKQLIFNRLIYIFLLIPRYTLKQLLFLLLFLITFNLHLIFNRDSK